MPAFTLITGASSGIGKATAERLAKEKRNLIIVARRKDRLDALKASLEKKEGVTVHAIPLDLTDRSATEQCFADLEAYDIDAVINNAGAAYGRDKVQDALPEDLEGMIDLNVQAFVRVAQLSIPHLQKTTGHLVNLGSIAGLEVYEGGVTYCATKHFVHAFSKGLRKDLDGTGIRVTEIAPGRVETEFSLVRYKGDEAKAKKVYEGHEPLRAEDIADAIAYALNCPPHVNIEHLLIMPTGQA